MKVWGFTELPHALSLPCIAATLFVGMALCKLNLNEVEVEVEGMDAYWSTFFVVSGMRLLGVLCCVASMLIVVFGHKDNIDFFERKKNPNFLLYSVADYEKVRKEVGFEEEWVVSNRVSTINGVTSRDPILVRAIAKDGRHMFKINKENVI